MPAPADLLAQLSDAAQSVAPERESITVGSVTFFADPEPLDSGLWFRTRSSADPVSFCRDKFGWYCAIHPLFGRGATPQEAFALALQSLVDSLLPLVRGAP